eukprot:350354-Chlamydomonas_euryale.AAC.2
MLERPWSSRPSFAVVVGGSKERGRTRFFRSAHRCRGRLRAAWHRTEREGVARGRAGWQRSRGTGERGEKHGRRCGLRGEREKPYKLNCP